MSVRGHTCCPTLLQPVTILALFSEGLCMQHFHKAGPQLCQDSSQGPKVQQEVVGGKEGEDACGPLSGLGRIREKQGRDPRKLQL